MSAGGYKPDYWSGVRTGENDGEGDLEGMPGSLLDVSSTPLPFHTLPHVRQRIRRTPSDIERTAAAFENLGAELRRLEAVRVARQSGLDDGREEGYREGRSGMVWAVVVGAFGGATSVVLLVTVVRHVVGWIS